MSEVLIRPAVEDDAMGIAACHVATWKTAYRGLLPDPMLDEMRAEDREPRWSRTLADPLSAVFVAVSGDEVVGFLAVTQCREDGAGQTGELDAIYVQEAYASQGIGGAFIEHADSWMREQGFVKSILWVLPSNVRAIAFYERHGWRDDFAEKELGTPGGPVPARRYAKSIST